MKKDQTKKIDPLNLKSCIGFSNNYLNFCIQNPDLFQGENFSTIQYCNPGVIFDHFYISRLIYNELARTPRSNTYLNFGMGGGFLEHYVENYNKVNLESVEWDYQKANFTSLLKDFDLEHRLTYECNDIRNDNFEIYNCNKKYDYIILTRFYPLNKKNCKTVDEVSQLLEKLKVYADRFIIFDDKHNYTEEVQDYFDSKICKDLKLKGNIDSWVIDS